VCTEARRIETHTLAGTLYHERNHLGRDGAVSNIAVAVDLSEQRAACYAGNLQPGAILPYWTSLRMATIRNADGSPGTFLIGLTATYGYRHAFGCVVNVFEGEGGQFAAPEASAITKQQQADVAGTDRVRGQRANYAP
jgi:hypothetical protein